MRSASAIACVVVLASSAAAGEVARAQPLIAPPPPLASPQAPPGGLALASPWLSTGWEDGLAEVADYDLTQFRYGNLHPGSATLIAVREGMDPQRQVKSAGATAPVVPVLKLQWIRSFQTGVYRYDQSSFQLVRQADGLPLRWFITSHEWCGTAGKSWVNGGPLRVSSYFDGHGDLVQPLSLGADAVPADSLWWWARAWVAAGMPALNLRVVPSQIEARAVDTTPVAAVVSGSAQTVRDPQKPVAIAAITVTVRRGDHEDRLTVLAQAPYTLLGWVQADGSALTLRQVRRFAYWAQHDPQDRPARP